VLLGDKVHSVISKYSGELGTFGHGYTASGHPVATAVALENIRIIEEKGLVANAARVGEVLQSSLRALSDHPLVGEVRGTGLIAAVELVADKSSRRPFEPIGSVGAAVFEVAHQHGLIVRGIQDSIAFCPPLIITEAQVKDMVSRFVDTLEDVKQQRGL
jgi:4-aminobutyrate--pyruvate transaminase